MHFAVAALAAIAHISDARSYHRVRAWSVALFWAARRLGASRNLALMFDSGNPDDSGGWLGPRRLISLVIYGDAPHVASLVLLTLSIGLLHVALEKRRPLRFAGCGGTRVGRRSDELDWRLHARSCRLLLPACRVG